ncbi:MAG: VRR-NUC domain-containing protein [Marinospirillum sp.]|uniref:VRR-NUC domain-containing protein n=1 Tax=Marinospirillum sp. TaxID=2183934 RepID=UPI0019D8D6E1|nr:VRR-NUC domain-containing protein [Marinospirillum sp.]MBE0505878.1 VRR-NUC domain-containing protein [Marinospirillum sp.]
MREQTIQNQVRCDLSEQRLGVYFRVNVGRAWAANNVTRINPETAHRFQLQAGDMVLRGARPFSTGLPEGTSDIIGGTELTVTQGMVGSKLLVWTAIEVKNSRGKATEKQQNFLDVIQSRGGISGVVRSGSEAVALVKNWFNRLL